jgi:hypothetical protein
MMFVTCAYTGCDHKIGYNPSKVKTRPRYCKEHMEVVGVRLVTRTEGTSCLLDVNTIPSLWIPVSPVKAETQNHITPPIKMVVLKCMSCKRQRIIENDNFMKGQMPECCGKRMIYHKDVEKKDVR